MRGTLKERKESSELLSWGKVPWSRTPLSLNALELVKLPWMEAPMGMSWKVQFPSQVPKCLQFQSHPQCGFLERGAA